MGAGRPHVYILNGPNLNMLGQREPEIYGAVTLADVEKRCLEVAGELEIGVTFLQSNWEGQIVDWLQEARGAGAGVLINPAGLSFSSIPLIDALKIVEKPIVEVHISNIHQRDELHRHSIVSTVAIGVIAGLGTYGYELGLRALERELTDRHA
ncbi:type II 3-dehydroquinate dehydratase [Aeromicrobium sp. IC_218]|nr:type II 3-dehydroquinate dehydratase [Aeromicrobium sp. IC_218]